MVVEEEAAVGDADVELVRPIPVREQEEEALLHAVVGAELWPPVADEVLPLMVLDDLHLVRWLPATPLPYHRLGDVEIPQDLGELGGEGSSLIAPAITGTRKQQNPSTRVYTAGRAIGARSGTLVAGTTTVDEVAAAAVARAAKVFLFHLPSRRPRERGMGSIASTSSLAFVPLPSGRPCLHPPDPLAPPSLKAPVADMAEARFQGRRGSGLVE
jgi:hypothetical protein